MRSAVVHYQELALKGRNRPWFIRQLVQNIRTATSDLDVTAVRALMGRIEVELGPAGDWDRISERLSRVFGIANYSRATRFPIDLADPAPFDTIAASILGDLPVETVESFRVSVRRADKRFPHPSPLVEREVGGRIKAARGWRVNLDHPALTVHIELLASEAFVALGRERGPGGLPTGSSGRVACLLSGGIDSPVAAHRMMKRGCRVQLVHFHSYPILSRTSQDKVRELAQILTRYQLDSRLFLVPFGDLQKKVVLSVPSPLRVVIYRRLMFRIAERIARRHRAGALVTGEVIGQVASQTLENMAVIGAASELPVLRPLVGMDKDEITAEAQRLGTYEISIVPDEDCCQLFTPRRPATQARLRDVVAAEEALDVEEMVASAVAATELVEFHFPEGRKV